VLKQLVLGSALGSIVLFIWSFIAWTLIPWPGEPLRAFTNEDAMVAAVKANAPRSGNYLMPNEVKRAPGMTDAQYQKATQDAANRMAQGPTIFAAVRLEPMSSMGKYLVVGFLTSLVLALLASALLLQTSGLAYTGRAAFVAMIGVIIFVGGHVDEWNWWSFSNSYIAMQMGVIVIRWLLASLVIAAFVRGKSYVTAP